MAVKNARSTVADAPALRLNSNAEYVKINHVFLEFVGLVSCRAHFIAATIVPVHEAHSTEVNYKTNLT